MAEKKKIVYIVEAMGGGVFTYIVDLANELVNPYDMYIAYMKKICVVSNVIGNRDVIQNGENGFVCSDKEEFVKAIKEAQNGADGFTERAYQDVLNMYNTKAMAKQYSEKYDKAINTRGIQHELILYVLTNDYVTAKAVA